MNILISNDDGISAKGMMVLTQALAEIPGNNVYVWGPDGQRSATGHGITTSKPITMSEVKDYPYATMAFKTSGTPADCVKSGIAIMKKLYDVDIDIIFSGINHGPNIGTDVFYSGTIAAAAEGVFNGVPGVAFSLGTHTPTDEQLENCATLIKEVFEKAVPKINKDTVLNVNFPDVEPSQIKGIKVVKLGPREYDEAYDIRVSPSGQNYFWYKGDYKYYTDLPEDLDAMATQDGYVTITPLRFEVTDFDLLDAMESLDLKY
ncbi:MAG: 5'/3'-nucleotidase SurE [Firmicutes bacterium]|nr:5'/3'-nucleotidase SurE [Bacillota bacterium]